MATPIFTKPSFINGVWAHEAGDGIDTPSNEKIALGHVVEKPPFEIVNYIENRQDQGLAYLFQQGISEWENGFTYPVGALVKRSNVVYKAITQNTGADPLLSPAVWEIAFYRNADGVAVGNDVASIKNTEGFLSLYVSKANPVITGRVDGKGVLLESGTPTTGTENLGLSFKGHTLDGIYHNGSSVVAYNNGQNVVDFTTPASITESSKKVVTMDILQQALASKQGYGVDDIYITMSNVNPATKFGYGTWVKFAEGMCIVGHSDNGTDPNWTRSIGSTYGAYDITLDVSQIPSHKHGIWLSHQSGGTGGWRGCPWTNNDTHAFHNESEPTTNDTLSDGTGNILEDTGGDQPHNNVQPSIVVYMWRRTA